MSEAMLDASPVLHSWLDAKPSRECVTNLLCELMETCRDMSQAQISALYRIIESAGRHVNVEVCFLSKSDNAHPHAKTDLCLRIIR